VAVTEWRPSRLFVRRLAIALAVLTIGAPLLVGLAAWIIAGRTVPPLNGERRVPGLRAPVEVLFDSWGVPHVYARDSDDAWLVAGYLQARERLWKMELYRRAGITDRPGGGTIGLHGGAAGGGRAAEQNSRRLARALSLRRASDDQQSKR